MKITRALPIVLLAFVFASPRAFALGPYFGLHMGDLTRIFQGSEAGDPKREFNGRVRIWQNGPTDFDGKMVAEDEEPGPEKIDLRLEFNADGTLTASLNGRTARGTIGRANPNLLTIKGTASGSYELKSGVLIKIEATGETNKIPTTITGKMNLDANGNLVLDLTFKLKTKSAIGKKLKISFDGQSPP
jgi:hypothetical protein